MKHVAVFVAAAAFSVAAPVASAYAETSGPINVVGVENEYADVISQIGGKFVKVQAIETDPNTDPHTFEASPRVAKEIAAAELIVVNGVGYDDWADKIMSATPRPNRKVINVQKLLGLPDDTANPHLWYDPKTMPAVAKAVADALAELKPVGGRVFPRQRGQVRRLAANHGLRRSRPSRRNMRIRRSPSPSRSPITCCRRWASSILTPFSLEKAIMDGTDPSPQDVTTQNDLFASNKVKVFAYNQQVTDALTKSFLDASKKAGIPVVGVYETMPTPGYNYQSWMLAETAALQKAVTDKASTETLAKGH